MARGAYILRSEDLGVLQFDVVTSETHTVINEITEHPVEKGANVTDHVRAELDTLKLEVFVSNAPIRPLDRFNEGDFQGAEVRANGQASILQFPLPVDNVSETYLALRKMRDDAELVQIVTAFWDYEDMLVKEVSIPRTSKEGDGAKMDIEFKQIRLVEAKTVPAPTPTEIRAKPSKVKGAQNGKEVPEGQSGPKQSVLSVIRDKLVGL